MKQKINKLLSIIILLGLFVSLFNCQKEDFEEDLHKNEIPFKMKIIDKDSILNNRVLLQKLKTIVGNNSNQTDDSRDMIYNSDYGFTVNTDYAKYIESDDGTFHSYTFVAETDLNEGNENLIENLVISLQTDGTYLSEITVYNISDTDNITMQRAAVEISTDPFLNRRTLSFSCTTIITYITNYNDDCTCEYIEIISVNTTCTITPTFNAIIPADDGPNGGGGGGGIGNIIWNEGSSTVSSPLVPCTSGGIGFGGLDESSCVSAEERFNPFLCNPLTTEQNDWIFDNTNNTDYADTILFFLENTSQNSCVEVDFEELILIDLSFLNNECLSNVYDQINNNSNTASDYLNNFLGENPVAHLKLVSSTSLPNNVNAQTSAPDNYVITITFNENNLDRPLLSIARTFFHELIHAEIYRKLLSVWQHPSLNGLTFSELENIRNDFPGLVDYYTRWKENIPVGMNLTDAQHQAMAQHYRDIIIEVLEQIDNSQSSEVYNALSWVGLQGSIAWNNLSITEQNNINQLIINFRNTNSNCQ